MRGEIPVCYVLSNLENLTIGDESTVRTDYFKKYLAKFIIDEDLSCNS